MVHLNKFLLMADQLEKEIEFISVGLEILKITSRRIISRLYLSLNLELEWLLLLSKAPHCHVKSHLWLGCCKIWEQIIVYQLISLCGSAILWSVLELEIRISKCSSMSLAALSSTNLPTRISWYRCLVL